MKMKQTSEVESLHYRLAFDQPNLFSPLKIAVSNSSI